MFCDVVKIRLWKKRGYNRATVTKTCTKFVVTYIIQILKKCLQRKKNWENSYGLWKINK